MNFEMQEETETKIIVVWFKMKHKDKKHLVKSLLY